MMCLIILCKLFQKFHHGQMSAQNCFLDKDRFQIITMDYLTYVMYNTTADFFIEFLQSEFNNLK